MRLIYQCCIIMVMSCFLLIIGINLTLRQHCWCGVFGSIYSGHQSILIPPGEVELNPALWLTVVSQEKGEMNNNNNIQICN